ncbi:MAG: hypothetical protein IPI67_41315 [Myxococcales bacterium]|nr:hypothetical protein [Myxococcales bacterium]
MAAKKRKRDHTRGLPSLTEARAERRRALVGGKVRLRSLPPQFWLWAAAVLAAVIVIFYKVEQGKVEGKKGQVMAKQRAVAVSLGPKILPFRDRVEGWVKALGAEFPGDFVNPKASLAAVETSAGVYLRLRIADTKDDAAIRKASLRSLHDGFTSCFYQKKGAPDPTKGPPCKALADCEPGQLCNEWDVCAPPPEPFNMRLAYRALRVLSSAWTDELHETSSELAIAAYERDLDRVTKEDVPVAAGILARARFFVTLLDEDPPEGLPTSDAGESEAERVQRLPHFARIGVWDLRSGELWARIRRRADARYIPVGQNVVEREESKFAQQRQVNSCDLAFAARGALAPKPAPSTDLADAGAGDAGAEAAADAGTAGAATDSGAPAPAVETDAAQP